MTIYLIRHGETQWNRQKLLQGSRDIPLNENGIDLARQTAEGLRRAGVRFDRVYTSPLDRAKTTARLLCPDRDLIVDERLREISFGDLEGTACPVLAEIPMPAPGGESSEEVQARAVACLRAVTADPANAGNTILLSTHGGVIRSILMHIKRIPHEDFWKGSVSKNCGVTILRAEGGDWTIAAENITFMAP